MSRRYLFGPVSKSFADRYLYGPIERGECRIFGEAEEFSVRWYDSWSSIAARFPADWKPDFLVLYVSNRVIPTGLWESSIPIIALAANWNLQWHFYRLLLRRCELVFTDTLGVEQLWKIGITQARVGNLFGCDRQDLAEPLSPGARPIDVLFIGKLHAAINKDRLPWLGRLGSLAARWNVQIVSGVFGEEYRRLLRQSRIAFNHSICHEWNIRVRRTEDYRRRTPLLFKRSR